MSTASSAEARALTRSAERRRPATETAKRPGGTSKERRARRASRAGTKARGAGERQAGSTDTPGAKPTHQNHGVSSSRRAPRPVSASGAGAGPAAIAKKARRHQPPANTPAVAFGRTMRSGGAEQEKSAAKSSGVTWQEWSDMHDAFDARWAAAHPSGGGEAAQLARNKDIYIAYSTPEARAAFTAFARKYVVIKGLDAIEAMHEANRCKHGTTVLCVGPAWQRVTQSN